MTEFKVGEEITLSTRPGKKATVEYGPFGNGSAFDPDVYVVKLVDEPEPGDPRTFTAMSTVMQKAPAFKVGDTVTSGLMFAGAPAELVAGPFTSRLSGRVFWVAERDGQHATPREGLLTKAAPEIKVGDTVRVLAAKYAEEVHGKLGTVLVVDSPTRLSGIAHPFHVRVDGDRFSASAVELVDEAGTYTHDGVTYDLTATYNDRDREPWTFERFGDEVRGGCNGFKPSRVSELLADVVRLYGPLTRV